MATQTKEEGLAEFMKKQEKKGVEAAKALFQSSGIDIAKKDPSGMNALNALKNGAITEKAITSILQEGFNEFEKETGRKMTYSEMREMYG